MTATSRTGTPHGRAIDASWRRSAAAGVDRDAFDPRYAGEPAPRLGRLARAAISAIEDIAHGLTEEPVSLLLTDEHAVVVHRWCADRDLRARLDRVRLGPGFAYAEAGVGTNGIGTSVQTRHPTLVDGSEHFALELAGFSCAGVPLSHPGTGALIGVVNLTASAGHGTTLMLPFVRTVATEIERRIATLGPAPEPTARLSPVEQAERDAILAALAASGGDIEAAAQRVGLSRATIYRRLRRYRSVSI